MDRDLLIAAGFEVEKALELVGDFELYEEILSDYYNDVDKNTELIKKCEKEEDIKNYTVYVHGIKSASKLIGANEFAKEAEAMEICGHNGDIDAIHAKTDALLDEYLLIKQKISAFMVD